MEAKFYFDENKIIQMLAAELRRKFRGKRLEVRGYLEDNAASLTVEFEDDDSHFTNLLTDAVE